MTDCEKPRIRGLLSYGMVRGLILRRLDVARGVKSQDEGRRLLGTLSMCTGGMTAGREGKEKRRKGTSPARNEEEKNKNDEEKLQRYRTPKQTSEKEMKIGGMGIIRGNEC
jgi:hypothetical protein